VGRDIMPVKCYEYFGCKELECPIYKEKDGRNCWEVEPAMTICISKNASPESVSDKLVYCKNCLYYEHIHKDKD